MQTCSPLTKYEEIVKVTPMLQQYLDAKERYPDSILFFRMGDFYEMFFEDAVVASRELGLTLTARNKGEEDEIPMAGVPHHAASGYISSLIDNGFAVAVCEQLEDPSASKGIVKRDVVRVVTPGVIFDSESLDAKSPNFVAAIYVESTQSFGIAYIDVSTGQFRATEAQSIEELTSELNRFEPREVLVNENALDEVLEVLDSRLRGIFMRRRKLDFFKTKSMLKSAASGLRIDWDMKTDGYFLDKKGIPPLLEPLAGDAFRNAESVEAASVAALHYVIETQRGVPSHVRAAEPYQLKAFLVVDESTKANLELTETLMGAKRNGSLLGIIDRTVTAMGARMLRSWLNYPLVNPEHINARLDAVEELVKKPALREDLRVAFDSVYDIERLCGRVSSGSANARDLKSLLSTLRSVLPIKSFLAEGAASDLLKKIGERIETFDDTRELIDSALVESPPTQLTDGGLFKRGFHDELDELLELTENGKDWILNYEKEQRDRTEITSLKVRYNKVFGYYLEVTKANLDAVPDDYVRKQTLANAERYFTPELKEMEERILGAEDKRKTLEYKLFEELRAEVGREIPRLLETAAQLARLDVITAFAELAVRNDYARPDVDESRKIEIEEGRHPVVERTLVDERFVPNSVRLDNEEYHLQIITGPNMAGKSTVIRQVALIVLMAQMGSFVPARSASIGTVDKIFSRVGASDNLARGQSTFMVEMTEAAHILNNATERSLVILDEIGRGTSTFDGLSIAWAVAEHLHDTVGAKTMFATHYHELTVLTRTLDGAQNLSIAVKEWQDDIIFLRKLVEGEANRSYGIQVGRLAGLPQPVVDRAKEVLENLEAGQFDEMGVPVPGRTPGRDPEPTRRNNPNQMSLFNVGAMDPTTEAVVEMIEHAQVDSMTPIEALNLLNQLKDKLSENA